MKTTSEIIAEILNSKEEENRYLLDLQEDKLWGNIRRTAKTNPALQEVLERVKILYYLSQENGKVL